MAVQAAFIIAAQAEAVTVSFPVPLPEYVPPVTVPASIVETTPPETKVTTAAEIPFGAR